MATPKWKILVTIRNEKRKETHETWQYWEIIGTLQWMGADRFAAYDTAKWILHAKPGERREAAPNIMVEVTERGSE